MGKVADAQLGTARRLQRTSDAFALAKNLKGTRRRRKLVSCGEGGQ